MSKSDRRQVVHVVAQRSHAHHDRRPVVVRLQIRGHGAASGHARRLALRFADERRFAIERRGLPHRQQNQQHANDRLKSTWQDADARGSQRGRGGNQRQIVPDAEGMSLHVRDHRQRRRSHQGQQQRKRRARLRAHDRRSRSPRRRRNRPRPERIRTSASTLVDLLPGDEGLPIASTFSGTKKSARHEPLADDPSAVHR